ncbi:hypothetical protein [Micromonospora sp. AMSO31t]|uniref:hypothetical protein n=1 Tax=Micromonospora sp. AMSO31t TaxID=2650566 RepID=UPI00124AF89A|nr:hypothetical protein [Micromonospora sp. AMSO31t]KAB1912380.1 hypothetical protein F8274_13975 [Micromonospora sp. AMSO31t]
MTGTPSDHDGEADDTSPAADTGEAPASGQVPDRPEPAPDRWKRWLARARELWTTTRDGAKRLWTAARPILNQLRWPDQGPEPPPVSLVDRRVSPTLVVPAQGQVYHFVVRATFTWSSGDARPELFGWYVDYFQPQAMQRLRRIAVRCAAEIPPDRPRELTDALEGAMTGDDALPWGYERGDVTFTCEPDVSVHLDEPVRKLLQPYWDKRIALEWKRDLERRRAEYAEEERKRRPAKTRDDGAVPTAGMPEALREEHPSRQREAGARSARRGPRPDSPVEQFTPLEPFPPPAPHPAPGQRPASAQPGETTPAPGDPDNPRPPEA